MPKRRIRRGRASNWGGRRAGAGRKPKGELAGVSHGKRPAVPGRSHVLVTLRLEKGLPSLAEKAALLVVERAFDEAARAGLRLVDYSIRPDHLHLVVRARNARALARSMKGLEVRIARRLNGAWRRTGRVFGDRYDARVLRTQREVGRALAIARAAEAHRLRAAGERAPGAPTIRSGTTRGPLRYRGGALTPPVQNDVTARAARAGKMPGRAGRVPWR